MRLDTLITHMRVLLHMYSQPEQMAGHNLQYLQTSVEGPFKLPAIFVGE